MSKIWYDHLVVIEEITSHLDQFEVDPEEKQELIDLIDQTLHHHVLNVLLNHLPNEHHYEFIASFHTNPADEKLLDYIKSKVQVNIEEEVRKQATRIKKEILNEIKKSTHKK